MLALAYTGGRGCLHHGPIPLFGPGVSAFLPIEDVSSN